MNRVNVCVLTHMLLSVPVYCNIYRGLYYFKLSSHRFCLRVYKSVYPAQFSQSSLLPYLLRASEEASDKTQPAVRCNAFSRQPQRHLKPEQLLLKGAISSFLFSSWDILRVAKTPRFQEKPSLEQVLGILYLELFWEATCRNLRRSQALSCSLRSVFSFQFGLKEKVFYNRCAPEFTG